MEILSGVWADALSEHISHIPMNMADLVTFYLYMLF